MRHRRAAVLGTVTAMALVAAVAGCGSDGASPPDGGGPITVQQLLERSADSPIRVQGLLHADKGITRLCGAVLESYPPQCGAPQVELVGLDLSTVVGTTTVEGVTWKEGVTVTVARAGDGRFTVSAVDPEPG